MPSSPVFPSGSKVTASRVKNGLERNVDLPDNLTKIKYSCRQVQGRKGRWSVQLDVWCSETELTDEDFEAFKAAVFDPHDVWLHTNIMNGDTYTLNVMVRGVSIISASTIQERQKIKEQKKKLWTLDHKAVDSEDVTRQLNDYSHIQQVREIWKQMLKAKVDAVTFAYPWKPDFQAELLVSGYSYAATLAEDYDVMPHGTYSKEWRNAYMGNMDAYFSSCFPNSSFSEITKTYHNFFKYREQYNATNTTVTAHCPTDYEISRLLKYFDFFTDDDTSDTEKVGKKKKVSPNASGKLPAANKKARLVVEEESSDDE